MTLGSSAALLAGSSGPVDVVLARFDLIRLAALVGAVDSTADEAALLPKAPGGAREAAVAAEAAGIATGQQVLG